MMKKKTVTIDNLAGMVQKGFEGVDLRFDEVDKRFDKVDERFDRMERLILADHKRRIEKLEIELKEVKDLLAIK